VRSLFANVSTTAAATMTVLIGMFLLGFLIGLSTWAFSLSNHYKHELVVKVYFNHGVADTGKEVSAVQSKLAANPLVKSVTPVSAEAGLAQMRAKNPELFKGSTLPYNPLGPALTVQPKRGEDTVKIADTLQPLARGDPPARAGQGDRAAADHAARDPGLRHPRLAVRADGADHPRHRAAARRCGLGSYDPAIPAGVEPVVVELARRGKLIVGEPYFTPGVPIVVDRKGAGDARPGDLAVVSGRRGRARVQRVLGSAKQIENVL